ncbi:MAG: fused MFS/spermidine synthase [Vicinamibacterales bacterium]|nr:fused MFS/spermidine synthase [Vicinamibacterales bacterium]
MPSFLQSHDRLARTIAVVYFLSGAASLIVQVAWQRVLTLHLGVGAVSTTIVVSLFMAGLGAGALMGGQLARRTARPLLVFVGIELALAAASAGSVTLLRWFTPSLSAWVAVGLGLWVPTLLMGMTLPLLTSVLAQRSGAFLRSVSRLYFMNTLGAACGALAAAYVLVSWVGLDGCLYVAGGIGVLLAALVVAAAWGTPVLRVKEPHDQDQLSDADVNEAEQEADPPWPVALIRALVFVTGFLAIGYEIIWYRVIGVLVKDSPYAFATVLAVYLASLATGGRLVERYLARRPATSRRDLYLLLQGSIGAAVLLTIGGFYLLAPHAPLNTLVRLSFSADLHPSTSWFMNPIGDFGFADSFPLHALASLFVLTDVLVWPVLLMALPTILTGASLPLAAALAYRQRGDEGPAVGTTFFFGVTGNAFGGLITGLVLLPAIGTERSLLTFVCVGLAFGLGVRQTGRHRPSLVTRAILVAGFVAISIAMWPRPGQLYSAMHVAPFEPHTQAFEEGRDAVVLTYADANRLRNIVNGQGHGYRPGPFFFAEAIEAVCSVPSPKQVLVIGLGAGSITEAALLDEGVEKVTVVELSESVVTNLRKFPALEPVLTDPRVRIVIGDGRRFLQQSHDEFDLILADPLRTTTAYSNNVHSRQFFALAQSRLAPGGVLMVGGIDDGLTVPATLLAEFEHVRSFPGFCLASAGPITRETRRCVAMAARLPLEVTASVREFTSEYDEDAELRATVHGLAVNDDWRPVSEYYWGAPRANRERR